MAIHKEPQADLRSKYGRYIQYGALASLGLTIAAFTVPMSSSDETVLVQEEMEVIEIEDIEQTVEVQPPPPPPPAPPPPVEVPDDVEIETPEIEDIELDLNEVATPPPAPPAPPAAPAPPPPPPPDAPAPPPPPPPDPAPTEPEIFDVVEQEPVLIGGLEGLASRLQYPEFARRANIEGTVFIQFVVDERGQVTDAVVARSPNDALSAEALRVVRESRFQPGQQRGRPVKVRYTLPVRFTLR